MECKKRHGTLSKKEQKDALLKIQEFCPSLRANKVAATREMLFEMPLVVQCMFLHYSWMILNDRKRFSDDSYKTAFFLFKLFSNKECKLKPIYAKYRRMKTLDSKYSKAKEWFTSQKGARKTYDKEFQRATKPESETDPLYIYYTTLYRENSKSPLAITWLTEHGVFNGPDRDKIVKKYKKLKEQNKLIK